MLAKVIRVKGEPLNKANVAKYICFLPFWGSDSWEKHTETGWAYARFKRCGLRGTDCWPSDLHNVCFRPEAGTNYWPSAFCKLLSPSNGENSHVGECLHFSLKAVLQIWRMSREENHKEKHYGGCKGKKHNFKGMMSERVKTQRQIKVETAHSQCQSLERTRPRSASTSGDPRRPERALLGCLIGSFLFIHQGVLKCLRLLLSDRTIKKKKWQGQTLYRIQAGDGWTWFLNKIA